MATSTLTLYKTRLIPSKNAAFDDIEVWLDDDAYNPGHRFTISNFQYIKFACDIDIKIPFSQASFNGVFPYNYIKIVNEGERPFYYFIMSVEWVSSEACYLKLSIDSVNTFPEWKTALTSQTKIIRQHEDRFNIIDGNIYPNISKTDEGIASLPKYALEESQIVKKTTAIGVKDIISDNWYTIFTSASGEETSPLVVKITTEDSLYLESTASGNIYECNPWDYASEIYYGYNDQWLLTSVDNGTNAIATLNLSYQFPGGDVHYFPSYSVNTSLTDSDNVSHSYSVVELNAVRKGACINFVIRKHYYNSNFILEKTETILDDYRFTYNDGETYINFGPAAIDDLGDIFSFTNTNRLIRTNGFNEGAGYPYATLANYYTERSIASGTYRAKLTPFSAVDRSDNKIVKIIEWPYCPIDGATYTLKIQPSTYSLNLPEGYSYKNDGFIYPSNLYPTFHNHITSWTLDLLNYDSSLLPERVSDCYTQKNINLETKLYNSNFYSIIFYYDVDFYEAKLENLVNPTSFSVDVDFYASNSMASKLFFKISYNDEYLSEDRFEGVLSSIKNNEMSILNNAYLEYLKTGYNYDKKQIEDTTRMSALSVGLQVVGATASYISSIWTGGAGVAAGIALTASVAGSIASSINNYQLKEASLQNKINQLKNQSSSVASINDLDLSKQYGGNKLRYNIFGIKDEVKQNLFDLFYYCGYAKNTKGIPNMDSRVWFNYIQVEPVFDYKLIPIPQNYIDDISARLNAGLTIYHYFDENFQFTQEYENWETSIINNL